MMSRSFREADHQKKTVEMQAELKRVEKEIEELGNQELSGYQQLLVKFYELSALYIETRNKIMENLFASAKMLKVLTPGRLVLLTYKNHINKVGLILNIVKGKKSLYKVLVLTDAESVENEEKTDLWYQMLALVNNQVFLPLRSYGHTILTISANDIFEIIDKAIKIDTDLVNRDWEKRQMERFKNDPVGQTCQQAIQEVQKVTMILNDNQDNVDHGLYLNFIQDLKIKEQHFHEDLIQIYSIKKKLITDHFASAQIPNFEQHFSSIFERTFLERKREELKHFLSSASLSLYPDYENRIELLQRLNYVDMQNRVQLKGRVACEMGMNELLITELVLRNILTKLQPAEVAALLSALVFSNRRSNEAEKTEPITEDLTKVCDHSLW